MADAAAHSVPRSIMDSFRRIVQALRKSSSLCEQATGLTGAQTFVLKQIAAHDGLSLNELAALTFTHQSPMAEVVRRLEGKRLVTRGKSPDDGRRLELRLGPAGRAALAPAATTAQENLVRAIATLPPETAAQLAQGLERLIAAAGLSDHPPVMFFEDDAASGNQHPGEPSP
jgi:DNA-binding MarR family transcriptional regulator